MSLSSGHDPSICRAAYKVVRQNGAPPVGICWFGRDFAFAETVDGKASMKVSGLCCAWAAKFEVAQLWIEKHKTSKDE